MNREQSEAILARQIHLTRVILDIKVKYMSSFVARFWPFGAFILGRTVFLKRALTAMANQGLVAHDSKHIQDKRTEGYARYFFKYLFSRKFRLLVEARGYAESVIIARLQGRDFDFALDWYAGMLALKYKLGISKDDAHFVIRRELFLKSLAGLRSLSPSAKGVNTRPDLIWKMAKDSVLKP